LHPEKEFFDNDGDIGRIYRSRSVVGTMDWNPEPIFFLEINGDGLLADAHRTFGIRIPNKAGMVTDAIWNRPSMRWKERFNNSSRLGKAYNL